MRSAVFILAVSAACIVAISHGMAASANLDCKIGPIEKTYGSTNWLVYSCDDHKSLVFVSSPGSKAFPFYFFKTPDSIQGEGTGDKHATDAAFDDLKKLSEDDFADLLQKTLVTGHAQ